MKYPLNYMEEAAVNRGDRMEFHKGIIEYGERVRREERMQSLKSKCPTDDRNHATFNEEEPYKCNWD